MPTLKTRLLATVAALALALGAAACGADDEDSGTGGGATSGQARIVEAAFLKAMIPHHESAVEMATMATDAAEHSEIRGLAESIIQAQGDEIAQMEGIYSRLFGEEIVPQPEAYEGLGLTADEAGMHGGMDALEAAREFDRVFIDMMIPHHQGAIRMAHAVIPKAEDAEIKRLAGEIIDAQTREIEQMNDWRKDWYGKESPSGGVPPADSSGEEHGEDGGEHME